MRTRNFFPALLWCFVCLFPSVSAVAAHRSATLTLSSGWRFQIDVYDVGEKERWFDVSTDHQRWSSVDAPRSWDTFEPSLWGYEGVGWYSIALPAELARTNSVQQLRFGRINYHSKVWLNGELLAENTNGYLPFLADVTGKLRAGAPNVLVIRVDNRPRIEWLPAAKQIEWIQYGGILQPVLLETKPLLFIRDITVHAAPDGAGATGDCLIALENRTSAEEPIELSLQIERAPKIVRQISVPAGGVHTRVPFTMRRAERWSPESPKLYKLEVQLAKSHSNVGNSHDQLLSTEVIQFGVRKIETKGRQLLLNGEPLRIRGVNRYDEYDRFGPNPPRRLIEADLKLAKRAGVNLIRTHYPQSPELLDLFDRLGFLLLEELPINWWGKTEAGYSTNILAQALPGLERMIARDKNHPFIQYAPFGPYGVVSVERKPKAALRALSKIYGGRID